MSRELDLTSVLTSLPLSPSALSLAVMDQQLAIKEPKKEPATFSSLPEDLVPPVVGFIRSWGEKEELRKDFLERRQKGRR